MRLSKDLTGKTIVSVTDGRFLGTVKDVYVNNDLYWITGINLGSEGLLKRKALVIPRDKVLVFGVDAILVENSDVVTDDRELEEVDKWVSVSKLRGRDVDTPGGTKVGTVGDIIFNDEAHIIGIALGRVFVEGSIAEKGYIPRTALIDTGHEDGAMTVDLPKAEKTALEEMEKSKEEKAGE